ncbi:MAG: pyridoxal 5'-phosphate synthase, partial [Bacteroidia bacterium]|nr:pyridoxal 5'-phosphate synthase [Bacteroidia bacterium]NNJ55001.1 pyridoxamine 5'-phosphate oxidase [Bacteroidia bacterium]
QLTKSPYCTLLFLWLPLERQIIIRGKAAKVSTEESEEYFNSRPRESQIGAWVSAQSQKIKDRKDLEEKLDHYTCEFEGKLVMKPENWGGFEVTPYEIEFWQGRENRLHDRLLYKTQNDSWDIVRLQP